MAPSIPQRSRKRRTPHRTSTEEDDEGERSQRKTRTEDGVLRTTSTAVSPEQSTVMDSYAPYLPQEIFTDILKRLPVKSLIRFHCVCKDWKNLFKTPSFIVEHVRHSTQQDFVLPFQHSEHLYLINRDMQVLKCDTLPSLVHCCDIIGSSNGLLCLDYESSFILWNPATREVFRVPKVPRICYVGFGFSPILNDYKIVTLSLSRLDDVWTYLVQVFSVSTRLWKEVEVGKLKGTMSFVAPGFSFDGAIFWLGYCKPSEHFLISFDIAAESFTLIPIPRSVHVKCVRATSSLTAYENKLAMLSNRVEYKSGIESTGSLSWNFAINLWVIGKCVDTSGERWIWTKVYTSNPFPDRTLVSVPRTIWRNEIVGVGAIKGKKVFVFCNLHTNEFKMLDMDKYFFGTVLFHYAESLVSVRDINMEASST